ncbi:PTS sugar transporter subunit IIA [Collinsella tanakaei]|jgi:PTS system fructose-specific IIA component|uniref:PTS sugar transporter subunit IIA n=1 Tax=Collinsella tanakaei TaxID=626935 RepID=UPI00248EB4BC|nr:PTS sugar transporter subunit IIA [Collinsella tanakaei]
MQKVFTQDQVLLNLDAANAEDVFRAVADRAQDLGIASADGAYQGLLEREREVATGLMDGYAIPHTKCSAVNRAAMFYVRTAAPLTWQTMDDQPVQHLFVLMAPDANGGEEHLKLLSALATCLLEDEFKSAVATAATAENVVSLVLEHIEKECE